MSKVEKPHILVVDDNVETCTLMRALLQRDFTVEVSNDGSEAIERLRTNRFSAVLLDLRMPQYDGFAVLDFLRDTHPELLQRVIVVTALLTARELQRARGYNVCAIVPKPFDVDALLAAVKQCAGTDGPTLRGVFCSPVIILLADLLRQKLM